MIKGMLGSGAYRNCVTSRFITSQFFSKMAIKIRSYKDKIRMACTTKGEERKIDMKIRFEDLKERGHMGYSGVDWKRELKWILNW